jgi:hypothetical protein
MRTYRVRNIIGLEIWQDDPRFGPNHDLALNDVAVQLIDRITLQKGYSLWFGIDHKNPPLPEPEDCVNWYARTLEGTGASPRRHGLGQFPRSAGVSS